MSNNNLGEIFYNFLRAPEAYKNTVYVDSRGIPTAGLGYACIKKDKLSGEWVLSEDIETFLSLIGVNDDDIAFRRGEIGKCIDYIEAIENENEKGENANVGLIKNCISEIEDLITPLKEYAITENDFKEKVWNGNKNNNNNELSLYSEYTDRAQNAVTPSVWNKLSTKEKTAVFSICYNSGNLSDRFVRSLQKYTQNRNTDGSLTVSNILGKIDAWHCILYRMNPISSDSKGIENRRVYEANEFLGKTNNAFSSKVDENSSTFTVQNLTEAKLLFAHLYSTDQTNKTIKAQIVDKLSGINEYKNNIVDFLRKNYMSAAQTILNTLEEKGKFNINQLFKTWEIRTSVSPDRTPAGNIIGTIKEQTSISGSILDDIIICEMDDSLVSGDHNNTIDAGIGNDVIYAGAGNDTVNAGAGNDTVNAGTGNDILIGGVGSDKLTGGSGCDTYKFNLGDGYDTIIESFNEFNIIEINAYSTTFEAFSVNNDIMLRSTNGGNHIRIKGSSNFEIRFSDTTTTLSAMLEEQEELPDDTFVPDPVFQSAHLFVPDPGIKYIYLPENFNGGLDLSELGSDVEIYGITDDTVILLPEGTEPEPDGGSEPGSGSGMPDLIGPEGERIKLTPAPGFGGGTGKYISRNGNLRIPDGNGGWKPFLPEGQQDLRPEAKENIKEKKTPTEETRSPLAIDLDGDGVETISVDNGVYFDHDGNGFAEKTGWIGKDDGILVRDLNNNGQIDNGSELFGNQTILSNGEKAANGFEALADLDSNRDGVFDGDDEAFGEIKVWQDLNQNGVANLCPRTDYITRLKQSIINSLKLLCFKDSVVQYMPLTSHKV